MTDDTIATDKSTDESTAVASSDEQTATQTDPDWPPSDEGLDELAHRLAEFTIPLDTTEPTSDLEDLSPLGDRLRDARVVGLGEATHGTREFFQVKHRILRVLVEELDYRLFALEANFAETLAIDEYVVHGRGDPKDALDSIYFWTWDTEAVLAMIEWLREFNEGRPVEECVRFYGVDAQFTAGPAEALTEFVAERDPAVLDGHRRTLAMLADEHLRDEDASDETMASRFADAAALIDALDAYFEPEEAATSTGDGATADAFALHRRHFRTPEQAIEGERARHREDVEALANSRDRAMAENLAWVLDHEPHDEIAVWAHDAHVQRDGRDEHWGEGTPMGAHLADRYGDDYYALGFDFADGEFQAIVETDDGHELEACSLGPPPEDAATRLFASVDDPLWAVDFDDATDDQRLREYFETERAVRSLGAVYDSDAEHERMHDEFVLPLAFDGLVFVAETERARPIERD